MMVYLPLQGPCLLIFVSLETKATVQCVSLILISATGNILLKDVEDANQYEDAHKSNKTLKFQHHKTRTINRFPNLPRQHAHITTLS